MCSPRPTQCNIPIEKIYIFKEGSAKDQPISHEYLWRWDSLLRKNNSNQTSLRQFNFWDFLLKLRKLGQVFGKVSRVFEKLDRAFERLICVFYNKLSAECFVIKKNTVYTLESSVTNLFDLHLINNTCSYSLRH